MPPKYRPGGGTGIVHRKPGPPMREPPDRGKSRIKDLSSTDSEFAAFESSVREVLQMSPLPTKTTTTADRKRRTSPSISSPSRKITKGKDAAQYTNELTDARERLRPTPTTTPAISPITSPARHIQSQQPPTQQVLSQHSPSDTTSDPAQQPPRSPGNALPQHSSSNTTGDSIQQPPNQGMPSLPDSVEVLVVREDELTLENDFSKLSSIKISRELTRLVGTFCEGKAINSSTIKFSMNPSNSHKIASLTHFFEYNAKFSIRPGIGPRDYIWGKIYSHSLFFCSDEEINEQLQEDNDGIIFAKRICRGESRTPTRLIRIKFKGSVLPKECFCLGLRPYEVTPYFPPVKKCNKCQQYGHWTNECPNSFLCKCGESHLDTSCEAPPKCIHCGEGHSSNDPNCSKFKHEKEIIAISHERNISFRDARAKVATGEISYATMAKRNTTRHTQNIIPTDNNVETKSVAVGTVTSVDKGTGRDDIDSSMGQLIDLNPNDSDTIIIPTKYKTSEIETDIRTPMYWYEEMSKLSGALVWAEEVADDKRESFQRALDVLLGRFRVLQEGSGELPLS